MYSAVIWVTNCIQNFDVFCGKITENLNKNPILNIELMLFNKYPY